MSDRNIFDKELLIFCVIFALIWLTYVGYQKLGPRRSSVTQDDIVRVQLKDTVYGYNYVQREQVSRGDHSHTFNLIDYALRLFVHDKIELASRQMEIILAVDSTCSPAFFIRGLMYSDQKMFEEAIPYLEKSIALNPQNHWWVTDNNDTCCNARAEAIIALYRDSLQTSESFQ